MFQFSGGVQEVVFQLHKHLQKKGHESLIITSRPRAYKETCPEGMVLLGRSAKMNTPFSTMVDFGLEVDVFWVFDQASPLRTNRDGLTSG